MRIGVIGGGPAGLYFALLMKARDARHEIHVMEQNPPDATYGWGLVFAAPTLRLLADSDPEFYADLRKDCAELDTMEIGHRGVRVAVKGNRWARVSRIAMLGTLQRHCLQRGVKIEFQARAEDVDGFAGFDLVVVADGVASAIRARARRLVPALLRALSEQVRLVRHHGADPGAVADLSTERARNLHRALLPVQSDPQHLSRRVRPAGLGPGRPRPP